MIDIHVTRKIKLAFGHQNTFIYQMHIRVFPLVPISKSFSESFSHFMHFSTKMHC